MTVDPSGSIVSVADAIIAQDAAGLLPTRPGKAPRPPVETGGGMDTGTTGTSTTGTGTTGTGLTGTGTTDTGTTTTGGGFPWAVLLIVVCLLVGGGLGVVGFAGVDTGGGTVIGTPPDNPVTVVPEEPDSRTVPANPTFTGSLQVTFDTTCQGQTNKFDNPAQLNLTATTFFLDPQGIPPFTGTVDPDHGVTARGQLGTVTGTLVDGAEQHLLLTFDPSVLPCAGPFPLLLHLPSPLHVTPTTTVGPPLAGSIAGPVAIDTTAPAAAPGGRDVSWPLIGGGGGLAVAGVGLFAATRRRDRGAAR